MSEVQSVVKSEAQACEAQAREAQACEAQTGEAQAGEAQSGEAQSGEAQSGEAQSCEAQTGEAQACEAQTGEAASGSHDFGRLLTDFMRDLLVTFPELRDELDANLEAVAAGTASENTVRRVREYCMERLPVRFFDILYQNEEMFQNEGNDLYLLPGIDFARLWNANITESTRSAIWKYLQLFLFDSVSEVTDESSFGETARLFEAVDEEAFRTKLEETIMGMQEAFDGGNVDDGGSVPKASDIHDHVASMMNGKLGSLAKEIAEETAAEMDIDMSDTGSVDEVFKRLLRNPTKLMSLVKNVGEKIDQKLKSGDIRESELVEEAAELVKRMKDTPGMGDLQGLLSKMGMSGGKMDMAGMEAQLARNMKLAKQRDRMREKRAGRAKSKQAPSQSPEAFAEQAKEADRVAAELLAEAERQPEPKHKKPRKKRRGGK
jgi:hypothetical protein